MSRLRRPLPNAGIVIASLLFVILGRAALAQEGVFLTEEQAPAAVFPGDATFTRQTLATTDQIKTDMRRALGNSEPSIWETEYVVFKAVRGADLLGYAIIVDEIGKHRPITFIVGVRPDGTVNDVAVMSYREAYGGEVKAKRFLNQYRDKSERSPLRAPDDIKNIAGATLSVEAASRAVKKALALAHAVFGIGTAS